MSSLYFVVSTATTVGYGDNYVAINTREKSFMIFLQFASICLFSLIIGSIGALKSSKSIKDILDKKVRIKTVA